MSDTTDTIPLFTRRLGSWQLALSRSPLASGEIRSRYDRAAPLWRGLVHRLGVQAAYRQTLVALFADRPACAASLSVLDCGAGTGALSLALAEASLAPVRVDAVDMSAAMLVEARRALHRARVPVSVAMADVRDLPFPDSCFDIVMAAHLLEHLGDDHAALVEMARVLRPGGTVILFLTRASLAGLYIHLRWRTRLYTPVAACELIRTAGLENPRLLPIPGSTPLARLSLAMIAQKPLPSRALCTDTETGDLK